MLQELDNAVEVTADTIQHNQHTLQHHTMKYKNKNCTIYMIVVIMILLVIIFILNILKSAFTFIVSNKHTKH